MELLIFEKKLQAETVCSHFENKKTDGVIKLEPNNFFQDGAVATWCQGHVLSLYQPHEYNEKYKKWSVEDLPIIPDFKKKVEPSKRSQFNIIRKWINHSSISSILHCGDAEREGTLIVDEVLLYSKNRKPVKRFLTSSLSKKAVHKALNNLKDHSQYSNQYQEAVARERSDWIIGMNLSRMVTLSIQKQGVSTVLPIGRIQSALLSVLVERDLTIENFKSIPYWNVVTDCVTDNGITYESVWKMSDASELYDFDKATALKQYVSNKDATIQDISSEEVKIKPPQLYNLTELQNRANKLYGMTPDYVLSVAQGLYERSILSYPRAEPRVVPREEAENFPAILRKIATLPPYKSYFPLPIESIIDNKHFVNDEACDDHYAIIPTENVVDIESLSTDEQKIYDLIIRSLIGAHYHPQLKNKVTIDTLVDEQFLFYTSVDSIKEDGWKLVYNAASKDNEDNNTTFDLSTLESGQQINIKDTRLKEGKTKAPKRFLYGELAKVMANVMAYIPKENRKGLSKDQLALGTVATRAEIMKKMIGTNYIIVKENKVYTTSKARLLIELLQDKWITSPITSGQMEEVLQQIGKGKKGSDKFLQRIETLVKNFIQEIENESPAWNIDYAVKESVSDKGKKQNPTNLGKCFFCEGDIVERNKFYGCSNYKKKNCTFTFSKTFLKKEIRPAQIEKLLKYQKTDLIKGFYSEKKDKHFDAYLIWDEKEQRVKLLFPERGK